MPPRYYQADVGKGVTNWTARPEVFPRGLQYIYERTGWLVMAHNRYWSATTPYAKQNGGKWDFLIDNSTSPAGELGKLALPVEQAFWDELLLNARRWGLAVYEQDWLNRETEIFPPLTESATLGRKWLTQMGRAAERAGLSIQCVGHSFARLTLCGASRNPSPLTTSLACLDAPTKTVPCMSLLAAFGHLSAQVLHVICAPPHAVR